MSTDPDSSSQAINSALKELLRGLTQNNLSAIYAGHKALYKFGAQAIPYIHEAIQRSNWVKIRFPNEIRYITGLISVLHDIDEVESRKTCKQLKHNGCDLSIAHVLDSLCRFTVADYGQYIVSGILVFEHKRLPVKHPVRPSLERWLKNIPTEDLSGIERIYVLRREDLDSLGTYTPILCSINVVWDNPCSRLNPLSWVNLINIESTLYHEIGHHIHRHPFGQDEGKEKAATKYSDRTLANSHHLPFKIMRVLSGPLPTTDRKRSAGG
jgi:hypothetical protein